VLCSQGKAPAEAFPWRPYHPWNYEAWAKQNPVPAPPIDHAKTPGDTRQLLGWLLGDGPVYEPVTASFDKGEPEEVAKVLGRSDAEHLRCRFGDLNGNFYYPTNHPASPLTQNVKPGKKLPTIIWLAPLQCSMGYIPDYRAGEIPHKYFAQAGFLVLAFDPVATGSRQEERRDFYQRYPRWSLMGQMVLDARHAIDAALANPDADPRRISLVDFGMGGMVATLTAALDPRVTLVVSASGFTPFRSDTDAAGTGGLRRWSHLYGWLPRLGGFVGNEAAVPVDFPAAQFHPAQFPSALPALEILGLLGLGDELVRAEKLG